MTAVHQVVSTFEKRDAVGNEVAAVRDGLRARGYESDVYTVLRREGDRPSRPLEELLDGPPPAAVVYHFAVASEATVRLRDSALTLVLVHHNVTPSRFYWGYDVDHHEACVRAQEEVLALRDRAAAVVAHSHFTARELEALGFGDVAVVPLAVEMPAAGAAMVPDRPLDAPAGPVLLTVGRVAPNKRIEDVIRLLHAVRRGLIPTASLWVVGDASRLPAYRQALDRLVTDLRLDGAVRFLGLVDNGTLAAAFTSASVYVSMSEHEGFGGPLLQAMGAGVPVLAFDAGAVAETLGGAGVLLRRKRFPEAAEVLGRLLEDGPTRRTAVARGHRRATEFAPDRAVGALVASLSAAGVPPPG